MWVMQRGPEKQEKAGYPKWAPFFSWVGLGWWLGKVEHNLCPPCVHLSNCHPKLLSLRAEAAPPLCRPPPLQAVPMHAALEKLDAVWDSLFDFSEAAVRFCFNLMEKQQMCETCSGLAGDAVWDSLFDFSEAAVRIFCFLFGLGGRGCAGLAGALWNGLVALTEAAASPCSYCAGWLRVFAPILPCRRTHPPCRTHPPNCAQRPLATECLPHPRTNLLHTPTPPPGLTHPPTPNHPPTHPPPREERKQDEQDQLAPGKATSAHLTTPTRPPARNPQEERKQDEREQLAPGKSTSGRSQGGGGLFSSRFKLPNFGSKAAPKARHAQQAQQAAEAAAAPRPAASSAAGNPPQGSPLKPTVGARASSSGTASLPGTPSAPAPVAVGRPDAVSATAVAAPTAAGEAAEGKKQHYKGGVKGVFKKVGHALHIA